MDSFVLLAYARLAASRALLQGLLAFLNFTLEAEDLSFWCKRKKWLLLTMEAAQAAENHGNERGLTWYFLWGIYTSISTWTHSQNSLAAAEAPSLKISSQMTTKTIPNTTKIVISYVIKPGILLRIWWKVNGNWDKMIRISQWRESHCRTNTNVRRKKEIQKSRTMRITVLDPSRKVNHLSKAIWDRKIITEFTRSISSTRIGKLVLMMDVKVSEDKTISRGVDQKNLIYVRWNRIENHAQRWRGWLVREKEVRHWVK